MPVPLLARSLRLRSGQALQKCDFFAWIVSRQTYPLQESNNRLTPGYFSPATFPIETLDQEEIMKTMSVLLLALICLGCGYSPPKSMPAQPGVMPAVAQLVPNTANSGDPQFTLTVNGSNFATNAVINWNGAKQTTTRVTGSQLMTTIPAMAVASPATVSVTVTNPGTAGTGGIYAGGGTASENSNAMTFTVN
jgi:hypothetical protein